MEIIYLLQRINEPTTATTGTRYAASLPAAPSRRPPRAPRRSRTPPLPLTTNTSSPTICVTQTRRRARAPRPNYLGQNLQICFINDAIRDDNEDEEADEDGRRNGAHENEEEDEAEGDDELLRRAANGDAESIPVSDNGEQYDEDELRVKTGKRSGGKPADPAGARLTVQFRHRFHVRQRLVEHNPSSIASTIYGDSSINLSISRILMTGFAVAFKFETKELLANVPNQVRLKMSAELQKSKKLSPIADIVGLPTYGLKRLERDSLVDMNVGQLQVIVNDLCNQIESERAEPCFEEGFSKAVFND